MASFLNSSELPVAMEGVIVNFRGGRHTQNHYQMIVLPSGIEDKEKAKPLVGKTVVWKTPAKEAKEIKGKIAAVHGGNGAVRVIFETGMPGQAVGGKVSIN